MRITLTSRALSLSSVGEALCPDSVRYLSRVSGRKAPPTRYLSLMSRRIPLYEEGWSHHVRTGLCRIAMGKCEMYALATDNGRAACGQESSPRQDNTDCTERALSGGGDNARLLTSATPKPNGRRGKSYFRMTASQSSALGAPSLTFAPPVTRPAGRSAPPSRGLNQPMENNPAALLRSRSAVPPLGI